MAGPVARIVSGGQSGVDRAALDFAISRNLDYGGWCPRGGGAEDLPDPPGVRLSYPRLEPTPSSDPNQRTRWNVRDSDATLILLTSHIGVSKGSMFTVACALALSRPRLLIELSAADAITEARGWIAHTAPKTLNVAGPRESESQGIYKATMNFLAAVL